MGGIQTINQYHFVSPAWRVRNCPTKLPVCIGKREVVTQGDVVRLARSSKQSTGEMKRREVSWTLTKKLAQKRPRAGRWSWAMEGESDFFCFTCFPTAELRTLFL